MGMPEIVGNSRQAQDLRDTTAMLASEDCPVIVLGESGTGKELVARALHRLSRRRNGPFIAVNCGAIAEGVAESELFGHERGAFTGATTGHRGVFEQADGGVLFLDEVANLSPEMQGRLLRVLQEGEVVRVGSDSARHPIQFDIRVVATTNKDIEKERTLGRFREDLYWRLAGWIVTIPPLRERGRDIVSLFRHFLVGTNKRIGLDAEEVLMRHRWPGNVRELQRFVDRVCILARGRRIGAAHLRDVGCGADLAEDERPRRECLMGLIDSLGSASRAEICTETGLTQSIVGKTLAALVQSGGLVRTGCGHRTRYVHSDRASDSTPTPTARQSRILEHTKMNGRITRGESAKLTGASIRSASRDIACLVELGRLIPDGRSGKSAGYVLARPRA